MIVTFPLLLLTDTGTFMRQARDMGRENGLDDDWAPASMEDALFEILLYDYEACGSDRLLEPLSLHDADQANATLSIEIILHDETLLHQRVEEDGMSHWLTKGRPLTTQDALLAVMHSPESPADYGFEIQDVPKSTSGHGQLKAAHDRHLMDG